MTPVTAAWARIEAWMRRHTPAGLAVLSPPATPSTIAAAAADLGLPFPADLVDSLRRHDGQTTWANILPEAPPLSAAGIVEQYRIRMELAPDVDGFASHGGEEPWWHERWLPFGDGDGDLQVIDLRPGPGLGRLGWAPHDNPADFSEAWPSLPAYLTAVADALETGGAVGAWHPYVTVDGTLWWDLADATTLNDQPLRPAPGPPTSGGPGRHPSG